jgi:hypothetical protein
VTGEIYGATGGKTPLLMVQGQAGRDLQAVQIIGQ